MRPRTALPTVLAITLIATMSAAPVWAQEAAKTKKPNILVIWGDDIGWFNISAYNMGMMGYKTPNIDRIGKEGVVFTDWYGQQSCTAGRAAFVTGQSPLRTGLLKVGLPGAKEGINSFVEKRPPVFPGKVSSDLPEFFPWWEEPDL